MVFHADGATVLDSLVAIHEGGANIALAVDASGTLVGTVTDGDVRRALLAGRALSDSVENFIERAPFTVLPTESRTAVLDLMQARGLAQVPVVNEQGILVGLHLLREMLGSVKRPNLALVLAGGRGSRLAPATDQTPKPMITVAGRPILERIVTHLVGFGIQRIALSVGYRHESIERHFGDGSRFGCRIFYLREDPANPLGTGGPLAALDTACPSEEHPIIVMNGDLITQFDVSDLLASHDAYHADLTVGIVPFTHEIPFGVIEMGRDGVVESISEKPILEHYVSAGIYAVSPPLLKSIPDKTFIPMTQVIQDSLARGQHVRAWHCGNDWFDVGRPQDLARARGLT